MTKQDVRDTVAHSIEQFLASGGMIVNLPTKKVRVKNTAACRYRRGVASKSEQFKGEEPRPLQSWCTWSPENLSNINYRPSFFRNKR